MKTVLLDGTEHIDVYRFPWTGKETVLDALSQQVISMFADLRKVTLVRPARGGQPKRSYEIDVLRVAAGERDRDLQVFPGDRILVRGEARSKEEPRQPRVEGTLPRDLPDLPEEPAPIEPQ